MSIPAAYTLLGAAVAAIVTAALFILYLKRIASKEEGQVCRGCVSLRGEIDKLEQTYRALSAGLQTLEETVASASSEYTVTPSLNVSKRNRVLRQHRSGESAKAIAAALHLPRAEVELLLKIHRLGLPESPEVAIPSSAKPKDSQQPSPVS